MSRPTTRSYSPSSHSETSPSPTRDSESSKRKFRGNMYFNSDGTRKIQNVDKRTTSHPFLGNQYIRRNSNEELPSASYVPDNQSYEMSDSFDVEMEDSSNVESDDAVSSSEYESDDEENILTGK